MASPAPLQFKPNLEDAARRWEAYYAGDLIDRPIVCVTAPKPGMTRARGSDYRERVFGDMDDVIDRGLRNAEATYFGGEAMPALWLSFGPDEVGAFCGAELGWDENSGDTNWAKPCVDYWETFLPLKLDDRHPLYLRFLEFYRRAAEKAAGKVLLCEPDLHTNMDLLMSLRGSERLCEDLLDCPELIDRAMADARQVFKQVWKDVTDAGRQYEHGFWHDCYSMEGAATLQCDFSCMISPAMFRRWVLPALEEEASIVKHVVYHWDGPGALIHTDDLVASELIHTLSYVPGAGHGNHLSFAETFRSLQDRGKGIQFHGSPEELKQAHKALRPEKTLYETWVSTPEEAEELLDWFVRNT
jgi:5-methyltetrahydrofolate--homocysteine methyltransferase